MKKIKVTVDTGYVGSQNYEIIEVEDNATEEEINELALEIVFELINYGWHEVEVDDEVN